MRYLIAFLIKYYFFFLFVFLEVVAIVLLINYNRYHSSVILGATSDFTGRMHDAANNITDYFSLKKQNEDLALENARLRNRLKTSFVLRDTSFHLKDSAYRYTPAEIINKSTRRKNNYFMLNKGEKQGVTEDMGVISRNGVVGMVIETSDNYSIVLPLIHKDAKISAIVRKNKQLANVVWDQKDYHFGMLEDIPIHINLDKGDTIVTSGYSFIFPAGLLIGTVEEYRGGSSASLSTAKIDYSVDFNSIDHVYVIENLMREEQRKLKENLTDE